MVALAFVLVATMFGSARVMFSQEVDYESITLSANYCQHWDDGTQRILLMRGDCKIEQGGTLVSGERMVVWQKGGNAGPGSIEVYIEGDAAFRKKYKSDNDSTMLLNLYTEEFITTSFRDAFEKIGAKDALYQRATSRKNREKNDGIQQTQMVIPAELIAQTWPLQSNNTGESKRRLRFFRRSSQPFQLESNTSRNKTPPEQVTTVTGGVNIVIDGVQIETAPGQPPTELGTMSLLADRVVLWTPPARTDGQQMTMQSDEMLQVYLEGNIVIRQGKNELRAKQAYIDIRDDRAVLTNAELKVYVPTTDSYVRVRAERITQLSRDKFHARNAWTSTSPFGKPGYRLQSSEVFLENRNPSWFGSAPGRNAYAGALTGKTVPWITSVNNQFIVGDTPLLALPRLSFPADDPGVPLRRAQVSQDQIFGFQVRTAWDVPKLLGWDSPQGLDWGLELDYLTDRGPAIGTFGSYQSPFDPRQPGGYRGIFDGYYIYDEGTDNLGEDRRRLDPASKNRGRAIMRHRQTVNPNTTLIGELGYISDRNFLEQYYENEFDESKDAESLLYLKQDFDNWSWSILARPQLNTFETTTGWLPKAELLALSEPLFGGLMTWTGRSSVGYARLRPGDDPDDPLDLYDPLPFVSSSDGLVAMTRHKLDAPFNVGPLKIVPYVMGEAAYWSEDFNGDDIDRLVGVAGIRGSMVLSKVYPFVQSRVFNLNGLAHKIQLNAEYTYTDSTQDLASIPQYNEIDDNAQERFRNRLLTNTFGGTLPTGLDPRSFALRSGAAWSVAAPYHELIDDQQVVRFNVRQRLQTRVGPLDNLRTKDWMTLDLGATWFVDKDRDNFGESIGLITGDYRWNVGERTSLVANGLFDVFDNGPSLWSVGILSQRSTRGSAYLGYRQVKGGSLRSQLLTASLSYQMSPKWVATFGSAYDVAEGRNRGQSLTMTRIGLDWITHIGASFDQSKDNVGFAFLVEPRFGSYRGSGTPLSSLLDVRSTR